jgi:hypothetical protein
MSAWKKIRDIGLFLQSVKGWVLFATTLPTVAVYFLGFFEKRPWSEIVVLALVALGSGLVIVFYAIGLVEKCSTFLTSRKEQLRISSHIRELRDSGVTEIDTSTAAAIWSGSREDGDLNRHLRFRQIKSLIDKGEIKNTKQKGGAGKSANIHTWMPLDELSEYFTRSGVIK